MAEFKDISENSLSGYCYIPCHIGKCINDVSMYFMMTKACTDTDCEFVSVQVSLAVLIKCASINQTVPKHSGQATQMYHSRG